MQRRSRVASCCVTVMDSVGRCVGRVGVGLTVAVRPSVAIASRHLLDSVGLGVDCQVEVVDADTSIAGGVHVSIPARCRVGAAGHRPHVVVASSLRGGVNHRVGNRYHTGQLLSRTSIVADSSDGELSAGCRTSAYGRCGGTVSQSCWQTGNLYCRVGVVDDDISDATTDTDLLVEVVCRESGLWVHGHNCAGAGLTAVAVGKGHGVGRRRCRVGCHRCPCRDVKSVDWIPAVAALSRGRALSIGVQCD